MIIGDYNFHPLTEASLKNIPVCCGILLMQDRTTGLFDIAVANNIRRRAEKALLGDFTPNLHRMYPRHPESFVDLFYVSLGAVARPTVDKYRVLMALSGKMVQRTTRPKTGYAVFIFTYPETNEYLVSLQSMPFLSNPMSDLHRYLNNKMHQPHRPANAVIRNFAKKHGPFDNQNSLIMELHKECRTLEEAKKERLNLISKFGNTRLWLGRQLSKERT